MKITACPHCGSKKIKMGTNDAGVLFGVTSWKSVCADCGYQGEPLLFDTEQEYTKFMECLSTEKDTPTGINGEPDSDELSKKDKDVIDLLKEEKDELESEELNVTEEGVFPKNKKWWIEIFTAMIVSSIVIIFSGPQFLSLFGFTVGILYELFVFIILTVFILFVIVIIEYPIFSMKRKSHKKKK